jgi:hypothetical protein
MKSKKMAVPLHALEPLLISAIRSGLHGYLAFENPVLSDNMQWVDGPTLGKLLVKTDATVLLNACRSAYADPPTAPVAANSIGDDPHLQVLTLGSLAQEVMDTGAAGVVAMRYNVYVVTAAQFIADLYANPIKGRILGEAVTLCRKQLVANPSREIAFEPRPLRDWSVPVVYEAAPISLFPVQDKPESEILTITLNEDQSTPDKLDPKLPKRPDSGFFGRDETLLALDRAFDTQKIVLLHAYAGSGKTATAVEFARWYKLTGGMQGPVLFTSFEQAEQWYWRSLELHDEHDKLGQAGCLGQLGCVARERFKEAKAEKELLSHINYALQYYNKALEMTPSNAVNDLAVIHNQLGGIYYDAGDLDRALSHSRDSIRYKEVAGNLYSAAGTRYNVALVLIESGRSVDALETAQGTQYQKFGIRDRLHAQVPRVSYTNPTNKRFAPYPICSKYIT